MHVYSYINIKKMRYPNRGVFKVQLSIHHLWVITLWGGAGMATKA